MSRKSINVSNLKQTYNHIKKSTMSMIKKLKVAKGRLIFALSVVVLAIIINGVVSMTTGVNVLNNTLNIVTNKMTPSHKEVKSIGITSDGYDDSVGGSYNVKKSAEWTSLNTAQVTFDVSSRMKTNDINKDVIFVLDISSSMSGDKLNKVKSDAKELTEALLSNKNNRVALITFESTSKIEYELTNDKEAMISKLEGLTDKGCTNYNQALINVDKVLEGYQKQNNRDLVVLFLTDGYPNEETPNEVAQYQMLKEKYPYIDINGVQYEMGTDIIEDIKNISDNQYLANIETLNNVLFEASVSSESYEKFEIVDYIDDDYFYIESVDDIKVSKGKVNLTEEKGVQKITWTMGDNEYQTGSRANMKINLKLKEQYVGTEGYYPTNKGEEVISKLTDEKEKKQTSKDTPILKAGYKVYYDTNTPAGCDINNFEEIHYAFENVKMSDKLTCEGYQFKGWGITDEVNKVNNDYFIMPNNDVTIKAIWTKHEIAKSMNGTIYTGPKLYEAIAEQSVLDNMASEYVTSPTGIDFSNISSDTNGKGVYTLSSTIGEKYPIYYYRGNIDNNAVIFAGSCWRILRTTETGGIKLVYNGKPDNNGTCQKYVGAVGDEIPFNSKYNSLAYNGYMYGTAYEYEWVNMSSTNYKYGNDVIYEDGIYKLVDTMDSSDWSSDYKKLASKYHYTCMNLTGECSNIYYMTNMNNTSARYYTLTNGKKINYIIEEMFANENNSDIKNEIDDWYKNNIIDYTQYLEDTIWCNDRSITEMAGYSKDGDATNDLIFAPYTRTTSYQPSLACTNKNDSFTVNIENGNGALTYPIGLITIDEAMYAGAKYFSSNPNYFLSLGNFNWIFSPVKEGYVFYFIWNGHPSNVFITNSYYIRPSISLKHDTIYLEGDGTSSNPYIIKTN